MNRSFPQESLRSLLRPKLSLVAIRTLILIVAVGLVSGWRSMAIAQATVSPTSIVWNKVAIGNAGGPKTVTLTNGGGTTIDISSIGFTGTDSGDFAIYQRTCGSTLAASSSCTASITFKPTAAGTRTATLNFTDSASNSPQQVSLSGTGTGGTPGSVTASPSSLSFGSIAVGSMSGSQSVTIANGTSSSVSLSAAGISGTDASDFAVSSTTCGSTLPASASCTASIVFQPAVAGTLTANWEITSSTSATPLTVALTGTGTTSGSSALKVNPANVAFGPQIIGRPSDSQSVTVTNSGSSSVTISSITSTGSAFRVTNTCIPSGSSSGTLAAGGSCSVSVIFDPSVAGSSTGSATITTSSPSGSVSIPLAGTGEVGDTAPAMLVTPQASCVLPSETQQFGTQTRNIANPSTITWYVDSVKGGDSTYGTISTDGLYTAPTTTGTYTVMAVDPAQTTLNASTTITVSSSPTFEIYPYTSSIPVGGRQTFQGQICQVPDSNATFTVDNIAGGNATVGTITSDGVYTAPSTAGRHTIRATDSTLNKTTGAVVTVFSNIAVDFGSRTNQTYPIRAGILGVNHVDGLHDPADMGLVADAGVTLSRTYSNLATVYATQTPDWTNIDPLIANLSKEGMHVLLEVAFTPPWLQPNPNPCGAGNTAVAPTNDTTWGQLAASFVAHMDANFPGVVTDYEIWNEPNAASLCGTSNNLNTYLAIYAAAAPLMRQQATADGVTIRIGGPAVAGVDTTYISDLLSNSSTAPYVDFVSYHNYMIGPQGEYMAWDTYNGNESMYDLTQSTAGANYAEVAKLVAAGKQPGGANTPIYPDEYNTSWEFAQNCCQNDPTYSPVWNALYVSDLLDQVYSGAAAAPQQLGYFAANAYPYFCMIGTWDTNMDCQYTTNSSPVPYPQYYAYELMGSPNYLGMNSGGYMAASVSPGFAAGGIETMAFYTSKQDSILIVNPTSTAYSSITLTIANSGFSSPSANLYEVANGNSISSSSLTLSPSGSNYTVTISVPAYTVAGISIF
jgi:hypothetical protein